LISVTSGGYTQKLTGFAISLDALLIASREYVL